MCVAERLMAEKDSNCCESFMDAKKCTPMLPPLPPPAATCCPCKNLEMNNSPPRGRSYVSTATIDLWERLFQEGFKADVHINTDNGGITYAHSNILAMASPVMRSMIWQASLHCGGRSISICGVPHDAVRIFIRFLYSSCLICHRMILKKFKAVSMSEGWITMKKSHPILEREILESAIDEENSKKKRIRKIKERKIYQQLYEAMEALVHICKDGCRTIGPHDKDFKANQAPCRYAACKGLESLVRHFAGCKLRVPGGCIHCKRMWQLLELHSRLCADPDICRVQLCQEL